MKNKIVQSIGTLMVVLVTTLAVVGHTTTIGVGAAQACGLDKSGQTQGDP